MNIIKRLKMLSENPYSIFCSLNRRGMLKLMPDRAHLRLMYRAHTGKKLDLKHPKTYNEKLQWIKLNDRRALYTKIVDKYAVREYVQEKIGEEYLVPLIGQWDKPQDIDFSKLPEQFVLKCNHDSGSVIICTSKADFDEVAARKKLAKSLKRGTYIYGREWPYKNVKPCIIAEQYLIDDKTSELRDYKFFAFDGVIKAMFIATDRQNQERPTAFDFFDADFNHIDMRHGHPNAPHLPEKPLNFEKMKALAEKLSQSIPEVRVDFYEVNEKIYFGEMTLFHHGGFTPFDPDCYDKQWGEWIVLPKIEK